MIVFYDKFTGEYDKVTVAWWTFLRQHEPNRYEYIRKEDV